MSGKRKYAVLTKAQGKIVTSLIKKGYSQKYAAKKIKIAKKSVSIYVKKKKIGKRVTSEFWSDVRSYQRMYGKSWKVSTVQVKHTPHWGGKRLKKLDPNSMEYWREKYEIERRLSGEQKKIWAEEEFVHGATPK